MLSNTTLLLC